MPTYDYRCDACDHAFEEFQSMLDKPLKKCPKCNKSRLRRLLGTGAAILFKGSGFYQTDYRSESYKSAAKADETAKSASSESKKTDDKASAGGKADAKSPAKNSKSAT
jgi:putative FmdB family regulatory protein